MADDLPDDWFRPRSPAAGDHPVPEKPTDLADLTPTVADEDERYTDQFKPGYLTPDGSPEQHGAAKPRRGADSPSSAPAVQQRSQHLPVVSGAVGGSAPDDDLLGDTPNTPRARSDSNGSGGAVPRVRRRSWLGRHPLLATLLVVALALVVGLSTGQLLTERRSSTAPTVVTTVPPSSAVPSTTSSTTAVQKPWEGASVPLSVESVTATCTAAPAQDNSGTLVTYDAANAIDDDPQTAWRCDGDGKAQKLTFTFPAGSTIVGVGVINGYAKSADGALLYEQYRRVLSVEWRMPDGAWFSQSLADNTPGLQQVSIPPTTIDGPVVMTIITSSAPGRLDQPTRDAVLLSQVQFFTKS